MSQRELAIKAGTSRTTICNLEYGTRPEATIYLETVRKLAAALGVDEKWLLEPVQGPRNQHRRRTK